MKAGVKMQFRRGVRSRLRGFLHRDRAVVLTYHSVLSRPSSFPVWHHLDAVRFEEQIAYLAQHRHCVTVAQLLAYMKAGRIPPYTSAVTFDDGFANNLNVALPILERYQVPATVFITTGYVDASQLLWPERVASILEITKNASFTVRGLSMLTSDAKAKQASYRAFADGYKQLGPQDGEELLKELANAAAVSDQQLRQHDMWDQYRTLTWDELRRLANSSLIELGAHTVSHSVLSRVDEARARHEIADSKRALEERACGAKYFAYPNGGHGDYTPLHRQMAIDEGFVAVFSAINGYITAATDRFDIPRFGVGAGATAADVDYALNGGLNPVAG
jgi:peptidoglycan/xylan/chitin deacetylase (PgdA/CDA1 family)